jgi:hypothetical protein
MRVFFAALTSLVVCASIAHDEGQCTDVKNDDDTVSFLQQFSVKVKQEDLAANVQGHSGTSKRTAIPLQLVMTGHTATLDELPDTVKENLKNTQSLAPGFSIRYLDDAACQEYLTKHFREEFLEIYVREQHGSFRGDICRSAVLLREGGFYADLDFQFHAGLLDLIDAETTLMTAFVAEDVQMWTPPLRKNEKGTAIRPILNALIAVRPESHIMKRTMKYIRKSYEDDQEPPSLLGPIAMELALRETVHRDCPDISLSNPDKLGHWTCGEEKLQFYQEEDIGAGQDCWKEGAVVCPPDRAMSTTEFFGSRFGVFRIGSESREKRLIGWSRYQGCSKYGCGFNGGVAS